MSRVKSEQIYDTYALLKKRVKLLIGARWEDKVQMLAAIKEQNEIRDKLSKRLKGKKGVEIIRKWRDSR